MSSRAVGRRPELIVVSAPSASGKSTLIRQLMSSDWREGEKPEFAVSHTTRRARSDEAAGIHYHFVDDATFDRMVEAGEFLEWATVHGRRYGTSRAEVEERLARGVDVLLEIDVQGAESVVRAHPNVCSVLILPPSYAELHRRIAARGHDDAGSIARRLSVSLWEIERYGIYDYVIINDEVERAGGELRAVIAARRCLRVRNEGRVRGILDDFRKALGPAATHPQRLESQLESTDGPDSRED